MDGKKPIHKTDDAPDEAERKRVEAAAIEANRLKELRLVMLGWRWPGKSLTGNTILGKEEFRLERAAEFCVKREVEVAGRQVTVIDTPGWFSNQDTPEIYQKEIVRSASMVAPGPHAFLLVIPVGMFTEVDRARIEEHLSMFGERVWRQTLVVFTWAEVLRTISIERHIRREGKELLWVLDKCKKRYFVINNFIFGEHPQLQRLMEKVEKIVAEEGGCYDWEEEEKKMEALREQNQSQVVPEDPTATQTGAAGEQRDLGARPKRNSSAGLFKPMEVEPQ